MASARSISRQAANAVFVMFCGLTTLVSLAALSAILFSLVKNGMGGVDLDVFTKSTPAPGSAGGLSNAIVGSLMMCGLAMAGALFVGVLAGTWLSEYGGNGAYAKLVRFLNDVLLSAPSILIGLFIYEVMVKPMHSFSGIAGALALALIAVPVITRATEDVLKLQPSALRESGVALGAPLSYVIRKIVWRSGAAGIVTGGLLAFARISGETAPLLFTALNNQFFSLNFAKPTSSLPVVIFNFALSPYDDWQRLAWVGAILITAAVLVTQIIARILVREPRR